VQLLGRQRDHRHLSARPSKLLLRQPLQNKQGRPRKGGLSNFARNGASHSDRPAARQVFELLPSLGVRLFWWTPHAKARSIAKGAGKIALTLALSSHRLCGQNLKGSRVIHTVAHRILRMTHAENRRSAVRKIRGVHCWREIIKRGFPFIKTQIIKDATADGSIPEVVEFLVDHGFEKDLIPIGKWERC